MSHHYLRFDHVHYTYPNGFHALRDISFCLGHGEKVALIGTNGSGKSTLLLHTNGLLLPQEGSINVGGIPVSRQTLPLIRRAVGLVFQHPDDQLFMPTIEEDVAFGPLNMNLPPEEVERRVTQALESVGGSDWRYRGGHQLSGGQKRSAAIATVLSMEPDILIMDEPTSNLDAKARRQFIRLIQGFPHTCLIATHDIGLVRELCPRTLVIHEGSLIADGDTSQVLANKGVQEKTGIEAEQFPPPLVV
ncbi:MAG: ABC transporter ATP-binding protein [Bacteroides sp.]|nr:ABC transporter ATP-binding protein [Bacteroides sp.]